MKIDRGREPRYPGALGGEGEGRREAGEWGFLSARGGSVRWGEVGARRALNSGELIRREVSNYHRSSRTYQPEEATAQEWGPWLGPTPCIHTCGMPQSEADP